MLANITMNDKRGQERKGGVLKMDSVGEWTTMSGKLVREKVFGGINICNAMLLLFL